MTKKAKPLNPRLRGRHGKMSEAELSALSDRYDTPGVSDVEVAATPQVPRPHHPHPHRGRKPGRPPKPAGTTVERVMISVEPTLLKNFDAHVARIGETRAGLLQRFMRDALRTSCAPPEGLTPTSQAPADTGSLRRPRRR